MQSDSSSDCVGAALTIIARIPPLDFASPDYSLKNRQALVKSFVSELAPLAMALDAAVLQAMPELQLPHPLACTCRQSGLGTPIASLLRCSDLCPACLSEATLALECALSSKARARARRSVFSTRLLAARLEEHVERQKRADAVRRAGPRMVSWIENGGMRTIMITGEPAELATLTPIQQDILKELRRAAPGRLTTPELCERTHRSRGALGDELVRLQQLNLIHNQKRKGYQITGRGLDTVAQASRRTLPVSKT